MARRLLIIISEVDEENHEQIGGRVLTSPPVSHLRFLELKPLLEVCDGCSECWLRCSEGVQANREEWTAIRDYVKTASEETKSDLLRVTQQNKMVDLGDDVKVEMCRYFDSEKNNCAIYLVRPLVCRLLGHVEWMPCPIQKVPSPVSTDKALSLMRFYAADERKTFAEWEQEV